MKKSFLFILIAGICAGFLESTAATARIADMSRADCQRHIARIVCLVDPIDKILSRSDLLTRPCLPEGRTYVKEMQDIYRLFPEPVNRMMCGLNRIFVEKKFWASGYAHRRTNSIGIQQQLLEEKQSLSAWLTWKERLSFQLPNIENTDIRLPTIRAEAPGAAGRATYYIVAHELAHLIDLSNGISDIRKGDFSRLSWTVRRRYLRSQTLPSNWERPCFYLCRGNKIKAARAPRVYQALRKSAYVSLYATRNPSEDFADTLTIFLLTQLPGFRYELSLGDQVISRMNSFWQPQQLREKLTYIDLLLKRPYVFLSSHGPPILPVN
ncbi:MAG: hypothetical protein ACR2OW_11305 [Methyloligellaceae bacterium]